MAEVKHSFLLNFLYLPLIPFLTYLKIDAEDFMILGILLILDFLSGMCKAYVMGYGIRYERAVAGVLSKLLILVVPIVLAFMALGINQDAKLATYINYAISALIIAETYSIIDNLYTIKTKENSGKIDLVSFVIRGIRAFLEKLFQGFKV